MRYQGLRKWITGMPEWGLYALIVLLPGGSLIALLLWFVQRAKASSAAAAGRRVAASCPVDRLPAVDSVCMAGAPRGAFHAQRRRTAGS